MHVEANEKRDTNWESWLEENLAQDRDPQDLVGVLIRQGVSLFSIAEYLGERLPLATGRLKTEEVHPDWEPTPGCDHAAIAAPPMLRNGSLQKLKRVPVDTLQLYTLDDFLSGEECDALVSIIDAHLHPSLISHPSNDKHFRTSRTCDMVELKHPEVAAVDWKIATTLGIQIPYSDGIQAQRYDVGGQFKHHFDYFEPRTEDYTQFAGSTGNRTWTFMVYLNEGMRGGGTNFPEANMTFAPKKGQAVIWNNLYPNGLPNVNTMHAGEPVIEGHKIIITKWFREKGPGPMFFEQEE